MTYNALPAASFLAIELLKQEQRGESAAVLPRSGLIQQLSTLVSDIGIVSPEDGNYRICKIGATAIQQVLDRILAVPRLQASQNTLLNFDSMADWDTFFALSNDAEAIEWLNSVDFNSDLPYCM